MTYISWSSNYASCLGDYLTEKCHTLDIVSCDTKSDIRIYVGQFDLYFMVQCLCLISRRLFDREMSYLGY